MGLFDKIINNEKTNPQDRIDELTILLNTLKSLDFQMAELRSSLYDYGNINPVYVPKSYDETYKSRNNANEKNINKTLLGLNYERVKIIKNIEKVIGPATVSKLYNEGYSQMRNEGRFTYKDERQAFGNKNLGVKLVLDYKGSIHLLMEPYRLYTLFRNELNQMMLTYIHPMAFAQLFMIPYPINGNVDEKKWLGDIFATKKQALEYLKNVDKMLYKDMGFVNEFSVFRDWVALSFIYYRYEELSGLAIKNISNYEGLLYNTFNALRNKPDIAGFTGIMPDLIHDLIGLEDLRYQLYEQEAEFWKENHNQNPKYAEIVERVLKQKDLMRELLMEKITFIDKKGEMHTERMMDTFIDFEWKYSTLPEDTKESNKRIAAMIRESNIFTMRYGVQ